MAFKYLSRKRVVMCLILMVVLFVCVYCALGSVFKSGSSGLVVHQTFPKLTRDWFFNTNRTLLTPNHHYEHNPPRPFGLKLFPCDWSPQTFIRPTRQQTFVHCDPDPDTDASSAATASLVITDVRANVTPSVPSFSSKETPCLKRVIKDHCYDVGLPIPRLAHYVRFGEFDMPFGTFLSVIAVVRFVDPCLVLFHGDAVPSGPYWRALLALVPNVLHVQMARPRTVLGNKVKLVEHSADVARLSIVREYGGIYLDTDHLVLRSLDDLRQYPMVMGTEMVSKLGNGFFLAQPEAPFLLLWQANYSDFRDAQWAEHSTVRPKKLSLDHPGLLHVVDTFFRPNHIGMPAMFSRVKVARYDWSRHYGVHLYRKTHDRLDRQDSVVGDMARHVLFGDRHACWRSTKIAS